jgi:Icc-related predicted phosphoesterase
VSLTSSNGRAGDRPAAPPLRIAAAGDMHCQPSRAEEARAAFASLDGKIDLLLLAGDLTTYGQPEQAQVLADACRPLDVPIYAVWGNHDWHSDQIAQLRPILEDAGITILDRDSATVCIGPTEIGLVGLKGFVGGFPGSHLPDFGEPLLRALYDETTRDVVALDAGLKAVAHCPVRIVLMHYAPTSGTLRGEPETIWTMLGNDRLAAPIAQHEPDMVLHGHAHVGTFEGSIGDVPVYNVSVPVLGRDFWVFELSGLERATAPLH